MNSFSELQLGQRTISHVIHDDLPRAAEDYMHRIGRIPRAGVSGQATSQLTPEDRSQWREITRLLQQTRSKIPEPFHQAQNQPEAKAPWQNSAPRVRIGARGA